MMQVCSCGLGLPSYIPFVMILFLPLFEAHLCVGNNINTTDNVQLNVINIKKNQHYSINQYKSILLVVKYIGEMISAQLLIFFCDNSFKCDYSDPDITFETFLVSKRSFLVLSICGNCGQLGAPHIIKGMISVLTKMPNYTQKGPSLLLYGQHGISKIS